MYTYMQTYVDEPGGIFGNNAKWLLNYLGWPQNGMA